MKPKIKELISEAVANAVEAGEFSSSSLPAIEVEEPKIEAHGDFSSNISMVMAAAQKMPPRKIAEAIIRHMDDGDRLIEKAEIAGPGFINFFVKPASWHPVLHRIHAQEADYGASDIGKGKKAQVEFVSANPTGPPCTWAMVAGRPWATAWPTF